MNDYEAIIAATATWAPQQKAEDDAGRRQLRRRGHEGESPANETGKRGAASRQLSGCLLDVFLCCVFKRSNPVKGTQAMSQLVIDLVAAANELPDDQVKLKHMILQLRDSHSIRTDLSLANDFLATMKDIGGHAAEQGAGGTAENAFLALFYSALILYVRATKTQHDHRRSFDFRSDYDEEQKVIHDTICDLRDKALAHYGPGGIYNGPAFQKDGVFIPFGPNSDGNIMTASRRLVINTRLIAGLNKVAHRALMLSERRTQALNKKVADTINEQSDNSPDFLATFRRHVGDLADFIGSKEAADEIMSGARVGYRRGTVKH